MSDSDNNDVDPWPEWSKGRRRDHPDVIDARARDRAARVEAFFGLLGDLLKIVIMLSSFIAALCIWAYQIYHYLRAGAWKSFSMLDVLRYLDSSNIQDWVIRPTDWLGLYHALRYLPVTAVLIVIAMLAGRSLTKDI